MRSLSDSEESIQILVKLLSGEYIPLTLPSSTTIPTLQQLLSLRTSLPASSLRITHAGKHLTTSSTEQTLSSLHILPNSTLSLALPVRGGMPPRKIKCTFKDSKNGDCKDVAQRIIGDCGFCSGHYCGKHRMLEDHKCTGLEDCKKQSHEQNAIKLNSERTMVVRGI